ncbi:sensor histidine kinase [Paenibacillus medicaginis]|uniref:histidine kinase n=1 Tax=Paenibacillus medicaginis TaxID=1470560 RepID=A0ABV5BY86_9BACL
MKLFFREHALLIVVQVVQFALMLSIYWLDGYRQLRPGLYSAFLGFFLLGCYLAYHYFSRRRYFQRLNAPLESLDASFEKMETAPVAEALQELLREQYRHYQEQLIQARREQEQHLTFMDQWVHQMKTPLSVIELTVQNVDEPEFASIREELEQLRGGLNTVLYMARLRTFEQDFHVKAVRLSKIISEVLNDNKRLLIRNQVYPEVITGEPDITAESDEKWLFFMISQIIINAVKYSAGSGEKVTISSYTSRSEAIIEIRDRGVGIPASDIKRVFDPFFTGDNGRGFRESTGMGLYLVKEAANRLGHRIELESQVGSGTTVRIIFASYQLRPEPNLTCM